MRIVLDTNILISGLLSKAGAPGRLLQFWLDDGFTLVTSSYQLEEFRRVLTYKHLQDKIQATEAADLLENLDVRSLIFDELPSITLSPDVDDNVILASAVAGRADLIVSGDKAHMQMLGSIFDIPIVTPLDALIRLTRIDQGEDIH